MFHKATSFLGMLFLAGTVILATAETSEAQRRGGRGGRSGGRSYSGGYYRGNSYYGRPYYGRSYGYGFYPYYGYSPFYYGPYYYPDSYYSGRAYRSYYPPSDVISEDGSASTAHVTVSLPADAELWFNGRKMRSTGSIRKFNTPPLTGGTRYSYEARARWLENGRAVTQTQRIALVPGRRTQVSFPNPSGTVQ